LKNSEKRNPWAKEKGKEIFSCAKLTLFFEQNKPRIKLNNFLSVISIMFFFWKKWTQF
jgi:hypothetical protein